MLTKSNLKKLFIIVLLVIAPMFAGAVNVNQEISIKNNGSGILKFTYMEKEDVLKQKNFLIGNLPFTKEKIAEFFKAPNSYVQLIQVEKNQKDNSLLQVVVVISFTDVNNLSQAKALNNINLSLVQTDTGKVFSEIITPAFVNTNSINQFFFILNSESNVKSATGKITDKSVSFFRGKEYIDGKTNINFIATFVSDVKNGNNSSSDGEDGKSCGLFGLELPIIMLAGFIFTNISKKKNTKI